MSKQYSNETFENDLSNCDIKQLRFGFDKIDDLMTTQWANALLFMSGVYPTPISEMEKAEQFTQWKEFYGDFCGINQHGR